MNPAKALVISCLFICATVHAQVPPSIDSVTINPKVFTRVETEASFPGGDPAWRTFLMRNLKTAIPVDNGAPIGKYTVEVQFVVGKDGAVSNIKALTNWGYGMEDEVIRVIERSGSWSPAIQNGKTVNAYRKQPITFLVEQDNFKVSSKVPYTLFAGIDNEITVDVKRVGNSNINLMITKGNIITTPDGRFIAKVNQPGRVTITVYNKKNDKEIGTASFVVKTQNEIPAGMNQ